MTGPAAQPPAGATMVFEGATWAVTPANVTAQVAPSKTIVAPAGGWAAGPVIDDQARRAYERRIRELQSEIDEARGANDPVRAERAEEELDALVQQLAEAFGLSGRARSTGSAAERARSAVGWRVRAALRQAAEAHPALGRHLHNAVRTGTWCSYRPETAVSWRIDQGRRA